MSICNSILDDNITITMTFISITFFVLLAFHATAAQEESCSAIIERKRFGEYAHIVAHVTHSLTLNDIRAFFKKDADENNGIPIVNFNLTDEKLVLANAPLIDSRFSFPAMFALDHILSNMEDNDYDFKNGNALDRLAHNLHMQETWANAAKIYRKLKRLNSNKPLCSCLDQVYGEWVTKSLLYL